MPDFSANIDTYNVAVWTDPATGSAASRLNDFAGKPRRYRRVSSPGTISLGAWVDGVHIPLDAALGGRLFLVSWVQWNGPYPPPLSQPAGQTSLAHCTLTPDHFGYFEVLFWRPGGGGVLVPFNVEY